MQRIFRSGGRLAAVFPSARTAVLAAVFAAVFAALCTVAASLHAQTFPTKPITLVVPFAAGGPTDVVARTLGASMTRLLGQSVVVENKLGAGGTIAAAYVAKAPADGYTIFLHHNGMASSASLYRKLPFNALNDFEYIGQVADVPMTLLARKDFPAANLKEMIGYVQANKEKINLANAGLGAVSHLCGMLLQQALGVTLTTVPFQGTAPAMNALLGSQVDLLCDQTTQTIPQIKAGSVKLYGVTTTNRIGALPDAPTLAEQGLKGFNMVVWHGVYAPKGTPPEVLAKINQALRSALQDDMVKQRLADLSSEIVSMDKVTPEGLRSHLVAETEKWGKVIKAAGVSAE